MKKITLPYLALQCLLFSLLFQSPFYAQSQNPDKKPDDPGGRQCEFDGHRTAGAWAEHYTPAHSLKYAKDKHKQNRIVVGTPKEKTNNLWMPIGPQVTNLFYHNTNGYGACSGRVTDFAFVPSTQRVYAATANGGVWYSDNNGDSWNTFNSYLANTAGIGEVLANADIMSCGAIAVSPDGKKLFVGTGEGSRYAADCQLPFEGYSYNGVGVVVSTDNGQTWALEPSEPDLTGHAFFSLAMDPANADLLIGATTNGLYQRIYDDLSPTKYSWMRQSMPEDNSVSSVAVSRTGSQTTFFAACWGGQVYKSWNGNTWTALGASFPTTSPITGGKAGRISIAVQPDNPNTVYALIAGQDNPHGGLFGIYRCESQQNGNGGEWKPLKCPDGGNNNGRVDYKFYDFMGGRGWWQMAFAVDPSDVNHLYAAGTEFFSYEINPNDLTCKETRICGYLDMVHPDIHVLKYQPNSNGALNKDRLWVGNDGGINFSKNASMANPYFAPKNVGLPTFLLENFDQHPTNDAIIYCGTQDNGGLMYSGGQVWDYFIGGDRGNFVLDWNKPDTNIMTTYIGTDVAFAASRDGNNFGWTEKPPVPGVGGIPSAYGDKDPIALAYAPIAGTPYNPGNPSQSQRTAFGGNKVFISDKWNSDKWDYSVPMAGTGVGDRIKALTFASYDMIYAGTMDGQIYRITQNGNRWNKERLDTLGVPEYDGGLPAFHKVPITSIAVDPNDASGKSIYITLGGMGDYRRVWRFNGLSNKWEQRSGVNPLRWNKNAQRIFPGMTSDRPIGLAVFKNRLYAAVAKVNENRSPILSYYDSTWCAPMTLDFNLPSTHGVNLAAIENDTLNKLVMTLVGQDGGINVAYCIDGHYWEMPDRKFGNATTNHPVSIAAFKGKFYLAYVGAKDKKIYLSSSTDAVDWSSPVIVQANGLPPNVTGVELAAFKDKLFLSWINSDGANYTTYTTDGKNWNDTGAQIAFGLKSPATLQEYDGLLYAFYNESDTVKAKASADGLYWPKDADPTAVVKSDYASAHQVRPAVLQNKMYLGYVNKSDNGIYIGTEADSVQPSLPNVQTNTIVVDPQNPNTLYVGNDIGVYYSKDAGASWMPYSNGLPGVPVNYLKIFPPPGPNGKVSAQKPDSQRFLRAATYGRSMFERCLDDNFNNKTTQLYIRKNAKDRCFYDVPGNDINDVNNSPDIKIVYPNSEGKYPFGIAANFYEFAQIPDGMAYVKTVPNDSAKNLSSNQKGFIDGMYTRIYQEVTTKPDSFRVYVQVHNHSVAWGAPMNMMLLVCTKNDYSSFPATNSRMNSSWKINTIRGGWKLLQKKYSFEFEKNTRNNWVQETSFVYGFSVRKSDLPSQTTSAPFMALVEPVGTAQTKTDTILRVKRGVAMKVVKKK